MLGASQSAYIYRIFFQIQQCIEALKNWVWAFWSAIFNNGPLSELKPLFVIGISISAVFLGILIIRRVVWSK